MTSLLNLGVIAIERVDATFWPFKHRFVKKWVYKLIIAAMWLITAFKESVEVAFHENESLDSKLGTLLKNVMISSYLLISLFVICVSDISIFIKVRCSRHPIHIGAARRERKFTLGYYCVFVTLAAVYHFREHVIFSKQNNLEPFLTVILPCKIGTDNVTWR